MNTPDPDEQIRAAYRQAGDCPPSESFLEAEMARLSPAERAELMEHAESCPACGAERELARVFDAPVDELEANRNELDPIVESLERGGPLGASRPAGTVVRFETRQRSSFVGLRGLAAAAVIAVAALGLWVVTRSPAPDLPSIGVETAFRGTRIEVVRPIGDLLELPSVFEWKPVADADEYRVRLLAVDDTVLWKSTRSAVSTDLPQELAGQIHPAVVYIWQVEALDSAGNFVARSERVRFRLRPQARTDTP